MCYPMSDGKPRKSADPLYLLLREGRGEEFNRRRKAGETCDLRGCDFRGLDLRGLDAANMDFSDCYFRQTDLRGLDLRTCLPWAVCVAGLAALVGHSRSIWLNFTGGKSAAGILCCNIFLAVSGHPSRPPISSAGTGTVREMAVV